MGEIEMFRQLRSTETLFVEWLITRGVYRRDIPAKPRPLRKSCCGCAGRVRSVLLATHQELSRNRRLSPQPAGCTVGVSCHPIGGRVGAWLGKVAVVTMAELREAVDTVHAVAERQ